jgi:TP901 family phage tail tape measure protein
MDVANLDVRVDSTSVKTASANLTGMGAASSGAMSKVKLLSGALVAMGAGRVLSKVISDTNSFTKSISELSAITGATGKDLAFYEEQAALIGKTTTLSASQAATAFKLIASAKPDLLASKEALAAVTKEAVTLAEAAGVDLADAAQTVGVSLNQFGAEADQAARFVNVLAAGAKMGSSSITDTSEAMKNAGVAAKLAGLSFEEANVGVQLLAKGGLFAAEAGTGFRQVLLKLENEAENRFKPSIVGLAGALENLAAEEMSLTELTELFGAEAMKSAAVMIAGAGDARTLEAAITGTSIASEMAATNFDNMEGDVLSLNSANEGLAITLGTMLEPAIRKSIQAATDFSRAVDDFVKSDKFIIFINIATKALMAFSIFMGVKLIAALGASVMAFSSAATAATLFGRAITLMGGPISAGVMALWGLYEILQKVTGIKADEFKKELQIAALGGVEPLKKHIQQLRLEQDRLTKSTENMFVGTSKHTRQTAELKITTEALTKAEAVLTQHMDIAAASTDASTEAADDLTQQFKDLTSTMQQTLSPEMLAHNEIVENQTDKYKDLTLELSQQMTQVTMNAKEQFLYNNQLKLGTDATMEERLSVETLSKTLFDAEIEQKAFTDAQDEMTKATDKLTVSQEIQKNMIENVQKSFGDLIYKTLDDGKLNFKSFFTSVLDGFKRMIAELAAQKIMEAIFGGGGINGFLSTLSGGMNGIISTIANGAKSMFASITGSAASSAAGSVAGNVASGATGSVVGSTVASGGGATLGAAGGGIIAAGGQFLAGLTGSATGIAAGTVGPPTAAALAGSGVGASIAAGGAKLLALATNPVTIAVAVAAVAAKLLDKSGTMSGNAGMLTQPLAGDRGFDVPQFASGAQFYGFNRREDQATANSVVDSFATLDSALTAAALSVGITPNLNAGSFVGSDESGRGIGAFLGSANEDGRTKSASLQSQLDSYATQWINMVGSANGVDPAVIADVIGSGTAAGILDRTNPDGSLASGINRIPFDGYMAELHEGERVQSVAEVKRSDFMAAEMSNMRGNLNELMLVVAKAVSKSARIESRWDTNGLPPTRT